MHIYTHTMSCRIAQVISNGGLQADNSSRNDVSSYKFIEWKHAILSREK